MTKRNNSAGTLLTLLGSSCWGLCAVTGKFIVSQKGVDPAWMVCLRLICAGLILLLAAVISGKRKGKDLGELTAIWRRKETVIRLFLIAIFAFAVCQSTYFAAIELSNAGVASVIQQTAPIFVMLYSIVILRRKPSAGELIALILVSVGAFLLATHGDPGVLVIPFAALVYAIISAITCACYEIMPAPLVREFGTYEAVGWGMLLGGILMVPVCRLWEISGTWDIQTLGAFAYVVLIGTVVAFGTFLYGVSVIGPVKGSILALAEPVVATILSMVLMHQKYEVIDFAGIAVILAGVITVTLTGKNQTAEAE